MSENYKLNSIRIKNFKAIRDSKTIKLTPLTVLIGNNGSGKSSLIEALETLQEIAIGGVDEAMLPWHGFEHIWNQANNHEINERTKNKITLPNPMTFNLKATRPNGKKAIVDIELSLEANKNKIILNNNNDPTKEESKDGRLTIKDTLLLSSIQFLKLQPQKMFEPQPQNRAYLISRLAKDGSNIAEYLQRIRDLNIDVFDSIIETMKFVLPYADDIKPTITTELERKIYLSLSEKGIDAKLPGWLLSTGTVRILALLAFLRNSSGPLIIEELENGLDPRTIHLIIEEIRAYIESDRGQVIITTHSPYLLDLLPLSSIVIVERDQSGSPVFTRPGTQTELAKWAKDFTPGKLYTMGSLSRNRK